MTGVRRLRQRAEAIRGEPAPGTSRWQPYLLTLGFLTLIWMALWGSASLIVILLGIGIGAIVLLLFPLPQMYFSFGVHPWRALVLVSRFLWDVVAASVHVAWLAVRPRPPHSETTVVQLESDSDLLQALTALAVSLVPGSLIIEIDPDRRRLMIHVLDADQKPMAEFHEQVRAQERRIRLALGRDEDERVPTSSRASREPRTSRASDAGGTHGRASTSRPPTDREDRR